MRRITHNTRGDVLSGYCANDWPAMCDAVLCIRVEPTTGAEVVALPAPALAVGGDDADDVWHRNWHKGAAKATRPPKIGGLVSGTDGTRTRGLRRDRPAL